MAREGLNWTAVGAVAGVLAVLIALAAWFFPTGSNGQGAPTAERPSVDEVNPEVSQEPVGTPSSEGVAAETVGFSPMLVSLNDAAQLERCRPANNSGSSWREEVASIGGVSQPTAFVCGMGFERPTSGYIDYLVPRGATRITAIAGQLDDSPNTTGVVRFEIVDVTTNSVLAGSDLSFGQSLQLDVPLDGVVRIRLQATLVSYSTSPWDRQIALGFGGVTFS